MLSGIETLVPGDHSALIYRTRAEQFASVGPFIRIGLLRRERCLYITNDTSVAVVRERLRQALINVEEAEANGSLKITTKNDTYNKHGSFQPEKMVADLQSELEAARASGYSGLRATGEMTWALAAPDSLQQLIGYEVSLHRNFSPYLTGLCQYDESRFDPCILSDIIRVHPKVIVRGQVLQHKYATAPEKFLSGNLPHVGVKDLVMVPD
jgi:chemotaxis family two-component system sensor kinase Cph1